MENRRLLPIVALVVSLILFGGAIIFALQSGPGNTSSPTVPPNQAVATRSIAGTIVAVGQGTTATPTPPAVGTGTEATPAVVATPTTARVAIAEATPTAAVAASGGAMTPTPTTALPASAPPPPAAPPPSAAPQPSAAPVVVPPTPTPLPPPAAQVPPTPTPVRPTPTPIPPPPPAPPAPPTATPAPPPPPTATPTRPPAPPAAAGQPPSSVGVPVRVAIPSLGVDAAVEQVGVDQDGNMATPEDPWNTAWFAPGTRPGLPGNAAIAGHVDYHGIGPVVFWDLRQIAAGAEVLVTTDSGQTLRFIVQGMEFYRPENAPLAAIFGPATTPKLNLITCSGTFDPATGSYDERLVVFTTFAGQR